ncbi:circularly permuted type 2 ATP-grasp protein [Nocardia callitridis]|uniref:circularly permuted type 2 ATP-grasp protein n=1 Tax=Nocardia callitridis TaxID=648753 RepID=UPI0031EBCC89
MQVALTSGVVDRPRVSDSRTRAIEQLESYRTQGQDAPYDECGESTDGYYDELIEPTGRIRGRWSELSNDFAELDADGLDRLDGRVRRLIADDGITYTEVGRDGSTPWRLDPVPLLVAADDWAGLEAGLVQRSRVLDEVLTDIYGPRRTLTSGLLPPEVVFGHNGYLRAAHGITVPGQHQLFLHGCDISRWADGRFRVLADHAQTPSGAGYALADRRVVSTAIPESFEHADPRPLGPFARAMRLLLIEAAQTGDGDEPVVVVLSPGAHADTAFDQAHLASILGFPLVESADLVVRDGALLMRSLGTLKRVDVVLRRLDARCCDPLDLSPDSGSGVVGLVEALRRGAVTVVNTLGSGLLENPALAALLPRVARTLLGEDLLLESAPSYWGGDDVQRAHLITNLHRLVLRSAVDGSTVFGPGLSIRQRAELKAKIQQTGWQWVGQEPAQFSVAPSVRAGALASAPVGMRLFTIARRDGHMAMTGGLGQMRARGDDRTATKVAAKDVWVKAEPSRSAAVAAETTRAQRDRRSTVAETISSPRVLEAQFRMGRYGERAEAVIRLLIATHDRYQDYRYRPWLAGVEALPVLMDALAATTSTAAPAVTFGRAGVAEDDPVQSVEPGAKVGRGGAVAESAGAGGQVERAAPDTTQAVAAQSDSSRPGSGGDDRVRGDANREGVARRGPAVNNGVVSGGGSRAAEQEGKERHDVRGPGSVSEGAVEFGSSVRGAGGGVVGPAGAERDSGAGVSADVDRHAVDSRGVRGEEAGRSGLSGAARAGHDYLVSLTVDREMCGSLAFAVDGYGSAARSVRDQLSADTWMILGAVDRAIADYRDGTRDSSLSSVHSLTLAALLALSGIAAESHVRDTGWTVLDIGKRIERGLALTGVLSAAFVRTCPAEAERVITESVLRATESAVSYRRRYGDSVRIASVARLLLFDTGNPRSLAYQLDRLDDDFAALPSAASSARAQRLLADAKRVLRRVDPDDLDIVDEDCDRTELAELLAEIDLRLRELAEVFETGALSPPSGTRPLWGDAGGDARVKDDSALQVSALQDSALQDSVGRDSVGRGLALRDSAARDRAGRDSAARDSVGRDSGGCDSAGRDSVGGDSGGRDSVERDRAGRDLAGRDSGGRDSVGGDSAGCDSAGRDSVERDSVERDRAGRDSARSDSAGHDPAAHDSAAHDSVGRDPAAYDSALNDPAPQNPAPQNPAPQNPAPQNPAPQNPAPQSPAPIDGASE